MERFGQIVRDQEQFLIVYSTTSNVFYEVLARRLATACEENSREARLCTAMELSNMRADELENATLTIVNPFDCSYRIGDSKKFFSRLSAARRRIMVLAEAVETQWFKNQFRLPIRYDALVDVGFVSQRDRLGDFDVPYRFLFNGPTQQEVEKIRRPTSSKRPIPWAIVGHKTDGRVRLVVQLMERLDPGGFVFLPNAGIGVRKGGSAIGPSGLSSGLSRTRYYVWNSHHDFMYYESFRFLEAILVGAVPCKIDGRADWRELSIPGIYPSVQALCNTVHSEGFSSMQDSIKAFYLSQGTLANHLEKILEDV
jgi:hypothetical protein